MSSYVGRRRQIAHLALRGQDSWDAMPDRIPPAALHSGRQIGDAEAVLFEEASQHE